VDQTSRAPDPNLDVCDVVDSCDERARETIDSLRRAGCDARHVGHAADSSRCVVVVAYDLDPPAREAVACATIRRRRAMGHDVVAFGSGVSTWPIGVRCRSLIAGASELLDHDADDFAERIVAVATERRLRDVYAARDADTMAAAMATHGLVGRSAAMVRAFQELVKVAAVPALPVLIHGETGTGKELLARAVHREDAQRRRGPFVPVNCGALNVGVIESELFGHRRGAFTGATLDRPGWIRSAHGGVLFLDEVGELELPVQVKLLRFLQEGRVQSVGDDRDVLVDVRVVAATHRDLAAMVAADRFRADLYHRLHVLVVEAPPLRDRREDIPQLVEHVLAEAGDPARPDADFLAALAASPLPGNVRQLENLVHRARLHSRDGLLRLSDLPPEAWRELEPEAPTGQPQERVEAESLPGAAGYCASRGWSLSQSLAACEREILLDVLRRESWNQTRAASRLGITPRSVYSKLRRHRIAMP
jgi:two-component system response regulator PilR (NtrC family)